MKKFIPILSALTLIFTVNAKPAFSADNADLNELAASLGSDTDAFPFGNYYHDFKFEADDETYDLYIRSSSAIEATTVSRNTFDEVIYNGVCFGHTIMEILAHNGVFSVSDIQSGKEYLKDIEFNRNIDRLITCYQLSQISTPYKAYTNYYRSTHNNKDENMAIVIDTAEKAQSEGRYFLIDLSTYSASHTLVGMGITDGSWTFNGIEYDKCLIAMDSNSMDSHGYSLGFDPMRCIYMNTSSYKYYIPATNTSEMNIIPIDNDQLLNYYGCLSPSYSPDTELPHFCAYTMAALSKADYPEIPLINEDGTIFTPDNAASPELVSSEEFYFKNSGSFPLGESSDYYPVHTLISQDIYVHSIGAPAITYSGNKYTLLSLKADNSYNFQIRTNDDPAAGFSRYLWDISGSADGTVTADIQTDGIVVSGSSGIYASISSLGITRDENGMITNTAAEPLCDAVTSDRAVKLSFNENDQLCYSIDLDDNGSFEHLVQPGDVNFDGIIDASDASQILAGYAMLSTGQPVLLNHSLSDYNQDGSINASDASSVLAYYAKMSTNNSPHTDT